MPAYELVIDPNGANETRYTSDGSQDGPILGLGGDGIRFVRNPNAVSNWRVVVPYDKSLENRISDEIWIQGDDVGFLFRGYLLTARSQERLEGVGKHDRTTELSGYGVEYDLTRDETSRTFQNQLVSDAIQTVWDNDTSFTATVTAPSPTDSVSDLQVQEANTTAEFNAINSNIADTDPFEARNGNIEALQTAHYIEAEAAFDHDPDAGGGASDLAGYTLTGGALIETIDEYSEGDGIRLTNEGDQATFRVSDVTLTYGQDLDGLDYNVEESNVGLAIRHSRSGDQTNVAGVEWYINDQLVGRKESGTGLALSWSAMEGGAYGSAGWDSPPDRGSGYGTLNAGDVDIRVVVTSGNTTPYEFDALCLFDRRYHDHDNFDNSVDVNQGNLDSPPQLYPQDELALDSAATPWSINEGTLTTTWNNTSGNQRIQLRLSPSGTYGPTDGTEDNTATITDFAFGSDAGSAVQGRARFDAFGSRSGTSPLSDFNGQHLQSWDIKIDGDDTPVLNNETVEGSVFQVLQDLHRRGRMDFWVDHAKNSKTANSAEAGDVTDTLGDITVKSRTRSVDLRDYANHVTVRGQRDANGNRLTKTTSGDAEITNFGKEHADIFTTLESQEAVDIRARNELTDLLGERETAGEITIVAKNLPPGPEYTDVPIDADNTISAQMVESDYAVRRGDLTSRLKFQLDPIDYGRNVAGLGTGIGDAKRGF